jgi:hypothetical protein
MTSYYTLFGIKPTADETAIKKRYRVLSKQYHPDVGGSQQKMVEINEAFHTLSDSWRRSQYDSFLRQQQHEQEEQTRAAQPRSTPATQPFYTNTPVHQKEYVRQRPVRPPSVNWVPLMSWFAVVTLAIGAMLFAVYGPLGVTAAPATSEAPTTQSTQTVVGSTEASLDQSTITNDTDISDGEAVKSVPTSDITTPTPADATDQTEPSASSQSQSQSDSPCVSDNKKMSPECKALWPRHIPTPRL